MANISKPSANNLSDLSQVSVPVSFSTLTGLALLLSDMIVSGRLVMPYTRTIPTSAFISGNYSFPTPNGYVAAPYRLPMLEPQTWNVVADIISAYQPVEIYQIGNKSYVNDQGITVPADLMTSTFPINIYPNTYSSDAGAIKPLELNQSVLIRVYKNSGVAINWQSSNILNNGLTDEAIQAATELSFVVTNILGKYQITEWLTPDFVTTNLSTVKTTAKTSLAAIINEIYDKIPTIPTKLPNPQALTFTGAATGSYDGSSAKTVNIPAAPTKLPTPYALTFTGAVTGTWDGSAAKTVNIPTGGSLTGAVRYDQTQTLSLAQKAVARKNIGDVLEDLGKIDNYYEDIPSLKPGQVIELQNSTARKITFDIDSFEAGDTCFVIAPGGFEPLPDTVQSSVGPVDYWPYHIGWNPGTPDPNPSPSSGDYSVYYLYTCMRLQDDSAGIANMYLTRALFKFGEISGSSGSGGSSPGGSGSGGY